jgi:hypothetical protein
MTPFIWATSYFQNSNELPKTGKKIDQCGHTGDGDIIYFTSECEQTFLRSVISKAWNHGQT